MPFMTAAERRAYREHVARMGIRDVPVENAAGYHEHMSTLLGRSSYPHGSPSSPSTPAHVTDMRRDSTVQAYAQLVITIPGQPATAHTGDPFTIHERFHQPINPAAHGPATIGAPVHDRYRATAPGEGGAYDVFAATADHATRQVTIHRSGVVEPPMSPRTQGR